MNEIKTRLISIAPFNYLHVLDLNNNVTRLEIGPLTFVCKEHEKVIFGPEKMTIIPPHHYAIVKNPSVRNKDGVVQFDEYGQVKLRHGEQEIRFEQEEPFPFYPGEIPPSKVEPFKVVPENCALKLVANRDFIDEQQIIVPKDQKNKLKKISKAKEENCKSATTQKEQEGLQEKSEITKQDPIISKEQPKSKDDKKASLKIENQKIQKIKRVAGSEWLFYGAGTYIPNINVDIVDTISAYIVKPDQALLIEALRSCYDYNNVKRKAGEQWLMYNSGAYIPSVHETVVSLLKPKVLTPKKAIHLRALDNFTDKYNQHHKKGDQWLLTSSITPTHIPHVKEEIINQLNLISLTKRQYCVIGDYWDEETKKNLFGHRKLVRGEKNFFLMPSEFIEGNSIKDIIVIGQEEALYVTALQQFQDKNIVRKAGSRWLVHGPLEYVPPLEVNVIGKWKAVFQIESLGIYYFYATPLFLSVLLFFFLIFLIYRNF